MPISHGCLVHPMQWPGAAKVAIVHMQAAPFQIAADQAPGPRGRSAAASIVLIAIALHAILATAAAIARQREHDPPEAFIATLRNNVIAASAPGRRSDDIRAALDRLIAEAFDIPAIATATLHPAGESATPAQRERLGRVLARRMTDAILRRRNDADTGFQIVGTRAIAADEWLVTTRITPQDETGIIVGWRLRREAGRFRIVDVTRDGASMVITQRQEIASALRAQRSLDAAIDDIERRSGGAPPAERP